MNEFNSIWKQEVGKKFKTLLQKFNPSLNNYYKNRKSTFHNRHYISRAPLVTYKLVTSKENNQSISSTYLGCKKATWLLEFSKLSNEKVKIINPYESFDTTILVLARLGVVLLDLCLQGAVFWTLQHVDSEIKIENNYLLGFKSFNSLFIFRRSTVQWLHLLLSLNCSWNNTTQPNTIFSQWLMVVF